MSLLQRLQSIAVLEEPNQMHDAAASGAGTIGASIVAGAGLPAKADVAAIAKAVARAIFFILLPLMRRIVLVLWDTIFCGPDAKVNMLSWSQCVLI